MWVPTRHHSDKEHIGALEEIAQDTLNLIDFSLILMTLSQLKLHS